MEEERHVSKTWRASLLLTHVSHIFEHRSVDWEVRKKQDE
jgi:hypothetical protein